MPATGQGLCNLPLSRAMTFQIYNHVQRRQNILTFQILKALRVTFSQQHSVKHTQGAAEPAPRTLHAGGSGRAGGAQTLETGPCDAPTGLEDVDQTHEQRAQLLAIEGVLLLTHLHSQLLCDNVLKKDANQLQQKPSEKGRRGQRSGRLSESTPGSTARTEHTQETVQVK